jgi:hypothetical protein
MERAFFTEISNQRTSSWDLGDEQTRCNTCFDPSHLGLEEPFLERGLLLLYKMWSLNNMKALSKGW